MSPKNIYKMSLTNLSKLSKESISNFLNSFDTVLTDCDGVLWVENQAIKGSPEVLNKLRELGKKIFFVTNNSTKVRDEFVTKAKKLGFVCQKVSENSKITLLCLFIHSFQNEIISTSYLAANYLKDKGFNKKVYVVGSKGIGQELDNIGVKYTGVGVNIFRQTFKTI